GTLNSSMILAENGFPLSGSCSAGTRGPQIAEGHHVVRPGFRYRLDNAVGGDLPIGLDALGERPRTLGKKSLTQCGSVLAQRLMASAAALQEGRGLVQAPECHRRRGHQAGQQRDVVVVAEDLRKATRRFGSCVKLRRPARCKQLHLPPVVLHALPPFVEIVVSTCGEANLKRLPRRAIAAPKPLGDRTEVVGIDREPGKGGPHL